MKFWCENMPQVQDYLLNLLSCSPTHCDYSMTAPFYRDFTLGQPGIMRWHFVMNHTPGAGLIARPVDLQSSVLPLYHRPTVWKRKWIELVLDISGNDYRIQNTKHNTQKHNTKTQTFSRCVFCHVVLFGSLLRVEIWEGLSTSCYNCVKVEHGV